MPPETGVEWTGHVYTVPEKITSQLEVTSTTCNCFFHFGYCSSAERAAAKCLTKKTIVKLRPKDCTAEFRGFPVSVMYVQTDAAEGHWCR